MAKYILEYLILGLSMDFRIMQTLEFIQFLFDITVW